MGGLKSPVHRVVRPQPSRIFPLIANGFAPVGAAASEVLAADEAWPPQPLPGEVKPIPSPPQAARTDQPGQLAERGGVIAGP